MRIRLEDIAARAGVSVSTVSLALSGHPRIAEATRLRVQSLARSLGYQAPGAKQRRQLSIGLVLTDGSDGPVNHLFHEAMAGILDETMTAGALLQVLRYDPTPGKPGRLANVLQIHGVSGALVMGAQFYAEAVRSLIESDYPFICIGKRELDGIPISWVSSDYVDGARRATEHLVRLGHHRIALLCPDEPQNPRIRERMLGYRTALAGFGLGDGPRWMAGNGQAPEADALPLMAWVDQGVTAAFALEHSLGVKLVALCNMKRVAVPERMAIVTFDDYPGAAFLQPPLTTVRQPMRELGAVAARTLLSWLRGVKPTPVQIQLQTHLLIRKSCGAERLATVASSP